MDKNIKAIIRGHLISIDCEPTELKKYEDELYVTKEWDVLVCHSHVSFKQGKKIFRFNYADLVTFFLRDCEVFVLRRKNSKQKFNFRLVME